MRELEDRPWFPAFLRKHQTDYLAFLASIFKLYDPVKPQLLNCLIHGSKDEWTDVCSGSGGPIISLDLPHRILLTDKYPISNFSERNERILFHEKPIDILQDEIPGEGLTSIFNAFHHFDHAQKTTILQKARKNRRPVFIAEILQPNLICLVRVILAATLMQWLLVPFMKPFSWKRLIFTYVIPIHTLTVVIDGIISVCKAGSATYLQSLAEEQTSGSYTFAFEAIPSFHATLYILYGRPIN